MRFESTGFQKSTFVDLPNDFLHFVVPVDVALRDRTAVNLLRRFLPRRNYEGLYQVKRFGTLMGKSI